MESCLEGREKQGGQLCSDILLSNPKPEAALGKYG